MHIILFCPTIKEELPPKFFLYKIITWYLHRKNLVVSHHKQTELEELSVSSESLLLSLRTQISWWYVNGQHPTKIIMGTKEYRELIQRYPDQIAPSIKIPDGVPLIAGLELVLNPLIDGVVIG